MRFRVLLLVSGTFALSQPTVPVSGQDSTLHWHFVERFRLGGSEDGPEAFYTLTPYTVAVGQNGDLTILDQPNTRVVQFDSAGRFVRMFGTPGNGPGEFAFPVAVAVTLDGVVVFEANRRSLLYFDPEGAFLTEQNVRWMGLPWGLAVDGDTLTYGYRHRPDQDGRRALSLRRAVDGTIDTLALFHVPPSRSQFFESCGVRIAMEPFFTPTLSWARAGRWLVVQGTAEYRVDVWGPDGLVHLSRPIELRPASQDLVGRELGGDMELGVGPSQVCHIPVHEAIEQRGVADVVPAVRDVTISFDGTVWVRRWRFPDEDQQTDIFTSQGAYQGTLSGPHPFPVTFLPGGRLVAIETDDLDVERIVVYDVIKQ